MQNDEVDEVEHDQHIDKHDEILDDDDLIDQQFDGATPHYEREIIEQEQKKAHEHDEEEEYDHFHDIDNILFFDAVSQVVIDICIDEDELYHVFDEQLGVFDEVETVDQLLDDDDDEWIFLHEFVIDDEFVEVVVEQPILDDEEHDEEVEVLIANDEMVEVD